MTDESMKSISSRAAAASEIDEAIYFLEGMCKSYAGRDGYLTAKKTLVLIAALRESRATVERMREALTEAQRIECEASCKFLSGFGPIEHSNHCVMYSAALSVDVK